MAQHPPVPLQTPRRLVKPMQNVGAPARTRLAVTVVSGMMGVMTVFTGALIALILLPAGVIMALMGVLATVGGLVGLYVSYKPIMDRMWLLKHGVRVKGTVTNVKEDSPSARQGNHVAGFTFEDIFGQAHAATMRFPEAKRARLFKPGDPVVVLYDPADPADAIIPAYVGAVFDLHRQHRDTRPTFHEAAHADHTDLSDALTAPLTQMSYTPPSSFWGRSREGKIPAAATLSMTAEALRVERPDGVVAQIAWDEPFRVNMSAFIATKTLIEVNVAIIPRGDNASREDIIAFKVRLPHSRVSSAMPIKQEELPFLEAEAFEAVYKRLRYHGQLHGERFFHLAPAQTTGSGSTLPDMPGSSEQEVPAEEEVGAEHQ